MIVHVKLWEGHLTLCRLLQSKAGSTYENVCTICSQTTHKTLKHLCCRCCTNSWKLFKPWRMLASCTATSNVCLFSTVRVPRCKSSAVTWLCLHCSWELGVHDERQHIGSSCAARLRYGASHTRPIHVDGHDSTVHGSRVVPRRILRLQKRNMGRGCFCDIPLLGGASLPCHLVHQTTVEQRRSPFKKCSLCDQSRASGSYSVIVVQIRNFYCSKYL